MTDKEPVKKAVAAPKRVKLRTVYPHVSFEPGDGLAAVTLEGTEYSAEDAQKVKDRAHVLSLKQGYPLQIMETE